MFAWHPSGGSSSRLRPKRGAGRPLHLVVPVLSTQPSAGFRRFAGLLRGRVGSAARACFCARSAVEMLGGNRGAESRIGARSAVFGSIAERGCEVNWWATGQPGTSLHSEHFCGRCCGDAKAGRAGGRSRLLHACSTRGLGRGARRSFAARPHGRTPSARRRRSARLDACRPEQRS